MTKVVLAVHGGAGKLPRRALRPRARLRYEQGLARALRAGQRVLLKGGSALNAIVEAVVVLEDDELFNAGKGAALCADGSVELSASIMRGNDLAVGAMVGLKRPVNPIRAARSLLGHAHGLLFGEKADEYAKSRGLAIAPPDYFLTPFRRRQWEKHKDKSSAVLDHSGAEAAYGTVGAVARDRRGNLAAATSTGGLVNQLSGRVGDTPVIGAGTWADNATCAVSATGKGDEFARIAFARRVADLTELAGIPAAQAALRALNEVAKVKGSGGCIVIDFAGNLALPFNTPHMLRGWIAQDGQPYVAICPEDAILAD